MDHTVIKSIKNNDLLSIKYIYTIDMGVLLLYTLNVLYKCTKI